MSVADRPGRDRRAERLPAGGSRDRPDRPRSVLVIGGGIAGLAAATGLIERGVAVTLIEQQLQLGGRVRSWPVAGGPGGRTMSRGFHAFFRQYYNLRALLRRADPGLARLRPIADYPLVHADGHRDSFRGVARTPPLNLATFVVRSPSIGLGDLPEIDLDAALGLLDVRFPASFDDHDGISAAAFLDTLGFPDRARHLALEVFARSFFAHPEDFSAGELIGMFHSYFVGSAEGLLFDVPEDDYDTALWAPLAAQLTDAGVRIRTGTRAAAVDLTGPDVSIAVQSTASATTETLRADAVVLAADPAASAELLGSHTTGVDPSWTARMAGQPIAPPFAVWRVWLDRAVAADRPAFLGTAGYGPLDNISVLERFERGAADWTAGAAGSVLELHAYALPTDAGDRTETLCRELWAALQRIYPEVVGASVLFEEFRVDRDCPAFPPGSRADRPTVRTPDPRLMLAGDALACELPVALMERAASTGFQAANAILAGWDVRGHDLWSTPRSGRHAWVGPLRRLAAIRPGRQRSQPGSRVGG